MSSSTNFLWRHTISPMVAVCLVPLGCSRAPAEPDPPAATANTTSAPAVAPLQWTAPGPWTALDVSKSGPQKASYHIPTAGNDKEEGTLDILFYGTGAEGSPDKQFSAWFKQFDGDVGPTAKREKFTVGKLEVETVEVAGTYKIPLGPALGPKKKTPMQMVKENFRLFGAVVKTPDRGNWFFKLAGPNDSVEAARGAWRSLLESVK